jgi:hypothetical protein
MKVQDFDADACIVSQEMDNYPVKNYLLISELAIEQWLLSGT